MTLRDSPPYNAGIGKVIELALANKDAEATALVLKDVRPLQSAYFKALDSASDFQRELASKLGEEARANTSTAILLLALNSLGAAGIGSLTAWAISRGLTRQLGGEPGEVVHIANAIAEGNLGQQFQPRDGDTTSIVSAMRRMNDTRKEGAQRVGHTAPTQQQAFEQAGTQAKREHVEVVNHRPNGVFRNSNSYGNDPNPPKDKVR